MKVPKIFKNSAIYTIVTFLQRCTAFLLLPLYTAFLTPADYGTVNVVLSVSSFMAVLIMVALNGAATRLHYKNKEVGYRKKVWGTITTIVLVNSVFFGLLFISFHGILVDPFIGDIDFYPYALIALSYTIISPLYMLFQSYLQASQNAIHFGINTLINFLLQVGLTILFVVHYRMGALGLLSAYGITAFVFFIYVLTVFTPHLKFGIDKGITRFSLRYSLPLLPHQISLWSAGTIDNLFLNGLKGKSVAGIYGIAQQFGSVVATISYSFNQAFVPWFYELLEEGESGLKKIKQAGFCAVISYCITAFALSVFSQEVLNIMVSENFREAHKIIPFVAFAFVFNGIYNLFVNVLLIDKTEYVFVATLSGMAVNIVLNILLIPHWGFYGCGIACLMTYFVRSIIALILSLRKNKKIRYNYLSMYIMTFLFFACSLMIMHFLNRTSFLQFIIKILVFILIVSVFLAKYYPVLKRIVIPSKVLKQKNNSYNEY